MGSSAAGSSATSAIEASTTLGRLNVGGGITGGGGGSCGRTAAPAITPTRTSVSRLNDVADCQASWRRHLLQDGRHRDSGDGHDEHQGKHAAQAGIRQADEPQGRHSRTGNGP